MRAILARTRYVSTILGRVHQLTLVPGTAVRRRRSPKMFQTDSFPAAWWEYHDSRLSSFVPAPLSHSPYISTSAFWQVV